MVFNSTLQTISCVLMFAMERAEFPVDTHLWHITKKLGWVPSTCSRESCYEHLNNRVPDEFKFALHVLLVDHGKVCKACSKGGGRKSGDKEYEVCVYLKHLSSRQPVDEIIFSFIQSCLISIFTTLYFF